VSGNVHHATLAATRAIAADTVEYRFALDAEDRTLRWRAGQYISLACGVQPDGVSILRSYTVASRPDGEGLRLVLKLVAGGAASTWFRRLPVGERVRFTGPMGFFVLDPAHTGDVVMAATGTGIAPFLPMLEELRERDEPGRLHLLWGLRAEDDLFWQDELARVVDAHRGRLRPTVTLSRPSETWRGERGRITARVFDLLPSLDRPTFYLCGNGAMIDEVKTGLVARGVDRKRQIRRESFFDPKTSTGT
jgi:CDP-4-dehydro-6-deoxyglucose reductase